MRPQAKAEGGKIRTVMREFGQGKLRSSSGQKVTNPKQAIAIGLSEQRRVKKMNDGGDVETKGYKAHYEREKAENIADREAMNPVNWAKRAYSGVKSLFTPGPRKDAELGPDKTEKKSRGGIASNPRFDKTIGADRKMGADYLSADRKQQRFMSGASTQAKVNRQDTRHGKIDMPFSQLNKYAGMREGGNVKNAQMEMRHAKAMKKAGLPKKMVREEMAEAKKYARGGGIESRGKTKGTVIRMASGGSVRGGGCEMRGKTKGKMV
jgi:hypothetical protein